MRIAAWVMTLLCLPLLAAQAEVERVVLDPANLDMAPLQELMSTISETDLGFRLAGIESEPVVAAGRAYMKVAPITPEPEKFGETGEDGLPDLPLISQLVAIPDQAGIRIEILSSSYQIIDNYDIMPTQPSEIEGSTDEIPFTKDEAFYQEDEFYPSEVVQLGEPIICRDLRMIQTVINPVQYNPARRQLKVYTNVDYRLIYEGTDTRNAKVRRNNRISEAFLPLYRAIVPNADEMLASYQPARGGYLIITPDAFVDTISILARWKHLKGYSVVITRATDINSNGNPTSEQVFSYIQSAYQNWDVPPEYVLIVGDENLQIPDYPYGGYASDHPYSLVDGTDFFSDVFVTRMSVPTTLSTLGRTMRKALGYDRNPYTGDPNYWLRGLSVAGNIYAVTPRLTTLWVRQQLMRHGFTRVDTVFGWSGLDPGATPINNSINSGVSIISYRGWAGYSGWGSPSYNQSNINGLTNGWKIAVMASLVCGTGMFDVDECFGETWIRAWNGSQNVPRGGPAFYGVSDGSTHTKWNNPIMIGYYWAILREGIPNFAAAAFRGKVEEYNTYPRFNGSGSWVERYFHTYNTLGEPEMEVRTAIPQDMTITYPSTLPVGSTMMTVRVGGGDGMPLQNAYVNLLKGYGANEEVFVGGRTDIDGDITLDFNATVADTMFVTVTAYNYTPHLGNTLIQAEPVAVNINATVLDDDNDGNSHGNSDGNANPGETIEFAVTLKNFGNSTTATNVIATLTSPGPDVTITVPTQSYGDIAPGNTANSGMFAGQFSGAILQGEHFVLPLNIVSDQGTWSGAVPVDIKSMAFAVTGVGYPGDSNNQLDPGETSQLVVSLENHGELDGVSLTGILTTSDTSITILDGNADFGSIGIGGSGSNGASPFSVQAGGGVYHGRNVNFDLQLTSSGGAVVTKTFSIVIGNVNTFDPVGPDDYGYYMYDNTDAGYSPVPFYGWIEISPYESGQGSRITFPSNTDDDAEVISLPFNFVYYGQSFNYMLVCINGFVALDTSRYDMHGDRWSNFDNNQLPEPGAPFGLIAPFWDDLKYDNNSGNYGVFKYDDSANHRFIIEWKSCYHALSPGHSPETFQMIIYDPSYFPTPTGDAEILFQYQVVNNNDNDSYDPEAPGLFCTVGMQNLTNDDGLQYTYDNLYHPAAAALATARAIKITTATGIAPPPEIEYDPTSFFAHAEPGEAVTDTLDIANVGEGPLVFSLSLMTDNLTGAGLSGQDAVQVAPLPEPIGYSDRPNGKPGDRHTPVYPPSILDQGGPDAYGNRWIDSDEIGGPVYGWVDITGQGTPVSLTDDSFAGPFALGFSFPFYENSYTDVYVSSNGYVSFGAGYGAWNNTGIPNISDPNNFIAMLWDDLNPGMAGNIYYYRDTENNRFIVSYNGVPFYGQGGSSLTFEVILYPTGRIDVEYNALEPGGGTSNTVGIENSDGSDGLQVSFNSSYLHNSMALMYIPPSHWLFSNLTSGGLMGGTDTMAVITFDASDLDTAVYTGRIFLNSNDPDESSIIIPVTFRVSVGGCFYVPGDINGNGVANGIDVVYGVGYFKGGPVPPLSCDCPAHGMLYAAGDVNGSCIFNGIDITYFVTFLKGGAALTPCPECPPLRLAAEPSSNPQQVKPVLKSRSLLRKAGGSD